MLPRLPWRKPSLGVFISYRHEDGGGYANAIYPALVSRFGAKQVFKDVDAINPGDPWPDRLNRTLSSCDVVIAVIGPGWLSAADDSGQRLVNPDDWVRRELEQALARGIPIVPALVGDAELPDRNELPETLRPLCDRQSIELRNATWSSDLARLVKALNEFAERLRDPMTTDDLAAALNDAVKHWQRVPQRARTLTLVGLGAIVVILLGVGFVIHWLLIAAAIAALLWLVVRFTRSARGQLP